MNFKMINISQRFLEPAFSYLSLDLSFKSPFAYYSEGCSELIFNNENNTCSICLNEYTFQKARPNRCNHLFCLNCLLIWIRQKNICPMCRTEFQNIIVI